MKMGYLKKSFYLALVYCFMISVGSASDTSESTSDSIFDSANKWELITLNDKALQCKMFYYPKESDPDSFAIKSHFIKGKKRSAPYDSLELSQNNPYFTLKQIYSDPEFVLWIGTSFSKNITQNEGNNYYLELDLDDAPKKTREMNFPSKLYYLNHESTEGVDHSEILDILKRVFNTKYS